MKKYYSMLLMLMASLSSYADGSGASVTTNPSPAVASAPPEVTITTDDFGSEVYCYSWCADINGSSKAPWDWNEVNTEKFRMSGSGGSYTISIGNISEFYGLSATEIAGLKKLGFIAKTKDGRQTADCMVEVVQGQASQYSGGEGSVSNPFILKTPADLVEFSSTPAHWGAGVYVRLDADIDASAMTSPIGSISSPYQGHFNGNHHAVSRFKCSNSTLGSATGFFGAIKDAEITDLGIVDAEINGMAFAGALVGYAESGSISRCFSTGSVTGSSVCVGGLIGESVAASISDCYSGAAVYNANDYATGGLIGKNSGKISNSYAAGSVRGFDYTGGVVGANYGTISRSVALNGNIECHNNYSARFGGNNNSQNISQDNISWTGITPTHGEWTAHGDHANQLVASRITDHSSFQNLTAWDFDNVWEWRPDGLHTYPALRGASAQKCVIPAALFEEVSSVAAVTDNLFLSVGPNPTFGPVSVASTEPIAGCTVISLQGACMENIDCCGTTETSLDLSPLQPGIYLLNVIAESGNVTSFKIIKK